MLEWLNPTGAVASVAGAALSTLAWLRARHEAEKARRLVRDLQRRQLVDDLTRLCGTVEAIGMALGPAEPAAARVLAKQLRAEVVALSARHGRAPVGIVQHLLGAVQQTGDLVKELVTAEAAAGDRAGVVGRLVDQCRTELAAALGLAKDELDRSNVEGKQGE